MKIFDSKSSKKISFNPLKEGKVSLYVCGMTVYDSCHIGHLRTFLSFDFIVLSFKAIIFPFTIPLIPKHLYIYYTIFFYYLI